MELLNLSIPRQKIDLAAFRMRSARESDYAQLLSTPFQVLENGKPIIVYCWPEEDFSDVMAALPNVDYRKSARTGGLVTRSRIFGFQPRIALRRDYCTAASLSYDQPSEHSIVFNHALTVSKYYKLFNPELYEKHLKMAEEKVLPEYRISGNPFTSGIINKNNPLKYHFDAGNFKNVWSAMLVFKSQIEGGHLSLPEYGIGVELKHKSLFLFDGQAVLHGVTPIKKLSPEALRFSIVYYSLQGMWNCEPLGRELERVRNRRTDIERRKAQNVDN